MLSTWLAFVVFSAVDTTPPRIVDVFKTFEDCVISAQTHNHELEKHPEIKDAGYVCVRVVASV